MQVQGGGPAAHLIITIPYRCSWRASWPRALLHRFSFSHLALPSRKTLSTSSGFAKLKPAAMRRQRALLPTPPGPYHCADAWSGHTCERLSIAPSQPPQPGQRHTEMPEMVATAASATLSNAVGMSGCCHCQGWPEYATCSNESVKVCLPDLCSADLMHT
ncbi:hypothetical protein BGY98DRAFT_520188 [Russula aff. rugulosa BPL654]|nr:hypothetical protein BGY98DRAFT_520188 [Russula aff. rugulosa BPL654]